MPWSVSNFHFGDLLGEGIFGKVYHARHKLNPHADMDVDVAIKAMDKTEIMKEGKAKMVLRERNALKKLSMWRAKDCDDERDARTSKCERGGGIRIVRLFMSFVDDHNLYLVQELCNFGTLSSFITQTRERSHQKNESDDKRVQIRQLSINLDVIRNLSGQILSAIEFMHHHSIVHCDLKPDNIMLGHPFRIKIIDFGCAIDMEEMGGERGIDFVGTSDYVSPEVIKGDGEGTSARSTTVELHPHQKSLPIFTLKYAPAIDLWAFGCLLYFMIEGYSPFHTQSDESTIREIIQYVRLQSQPPLRQGHLERMTTTSSERFWWKKKHEIITTNSCIFAAENIALLDLVKSFLVADPASRLGMGEIVPIDSSAKLCNNKNSDKHRNKYASIRSHCFYNGLDWTQVDHGDDNENSFFKALHIPAATVDTDMKIENMADGARLPFDFFT